MFLSIKIISTNFLKDQSFFKILKKKIKIVLWQTNSMNSFYRCIINQCIVKYLCQTNFIKTLLFDKFIRPKYYIFKVSLIIKYKVKSIYYDHLLLWLKLFFEIKVFVGKQKYIFFGQLTLDIQIIMVFIELKFYGYVQTFIPIILGFWGNKNQSQKVLIGKKIHG